MSSIREIGNDLPVKIIDDYVSSIINPTALASKMYVIPLSCWEIFETRNAATNTTWRSRCCRQISNLTAMPDEMNYIVFPKLSKVMQGSVSSLHFQLCVVEKLTKKIKIFCSLQRAEETGRDIQTFLNQILGTQTTWSWTEEPEIECPEMLLQEFNVCGFYIVGWIETLAAALVTGDGRLPRRWESSLRAVDVWHVCRRLRDFEIEMDIEAHAKRAIHENDSDIGNSDVEIVGSPDDVDWDGNYNDDDDDDARPMSESELVDEVPEPTPSKPPAERGAICTKGGSVKEPCAKRSRTTKPRGYRVEWETSFPWIEPSPDKTEIFYRYCRKFSKALPNLGMPPHKPQFCEVGFTSFNKLNEGCKDHQKSSRHIECIRAERNHRDGTAVTRMLDDFEGSQGRNRKKLLTLFRAIRFLSRQGLAFRGQTDRNSNMTQLTSLLTEGSGIKIGSHGYSSHDLQKEMIKLLSHTILRAFSKEVLSCPCYSVSLDECLNNTTQSQVYICVRYVDLALVTKEIFIGFIPVQSQDANTLFSALVHVMRGFGLDTQKCTGITVDGAPVMTGSLGGVRGLMQNMVPLCLFVYCLAHGFNLVLKDVVETVDPRFKVVFEFIQTVAKNLSFLGKLEWRSMNLANSQIWWTTETGQREILWQFAQLGGHSDGLR